MALMHQITYRFHLPEGPEEIALAFDDREFALVTPPIKDAPAWTRLDFHRCPHCPLPAAGGPYCPYAVALAGFVERFDKFYSYDMAVIEVVTENRTIIARKSLQTGMAGLMGLIGATSGCPSLAFFRPMARYHLPFSRDDETLYRVFSSYLLGRYLLDGGTDAASLEELARLSKEAMSVNHAMADRIRAAFSKDVVVNAIIILDSFAQAVPLVIDDRLEELRRLYPAV